jgi:UrcA family protein
MITTMRKKGRRAGLTVLITSALVSAAAVAAEPQTEEVVVQAERPTQKVLARTAGAVSGVPIVQYELRYRVSYADLDLATSTGANSLKTRVQQAAQSACADLDKLYPLADPDRSCARKAEEGAMPKVNEAIAAAQGKVR